MPLGQGLKPRDKNLTEVLEFTIIKLKLLDKNHRLKAIQEFIVVLDIRAAKHPRVKVPK